jgi:hypothetical protein
LKSPYADPFDDELDDIAAALDSLDDCPRGEGGEA